MGHELMNGGPRSTVVVHAALACAVARQAYDRGFEQLPNF